MRKAVKRSIILVNLFFVVLLLLSCLAPYISPATFWPIAFLGLMFPFLFLLNIGFATFWLLASPRVALLSFLALFMSIANLTSYFSFAGDQGDVTPTKKAYSILSYNVKNFDLYNWSNNKASRDKMLKAIRDADADIVCLQEFYTNDTQGFRNLEVLKNIYPYFQFQETYVSKKNHRWGIATFSRYPIVKKDILSFENARHNLSIVSDIQLDNSQKIRLYNVHLQSVHLAQQDYDHLEHPGQNNLQSVTSIFTKLKTAFEKRALQAELIKASVESAELPVIVSGDFNDSPNSYAYRTIAKGMKDSFHEAGNGIGATYLGPIPALRIDFMLMDRKMNVWQHKVIDEIHSDHFPVYSRFSVQ